MSKVCVYIDCNMQSGRIFIVNCHTNEVDGQTRSGAKRPLITKLPTTPENPINVIKGSVREIRKDGPRGRHPGRCETDVERLRRQRHARRRTASERYGETREVTE